MPDEPQIGAIETGKDGTQYRYKGGDRYDKANWTQVEAPSPGFTIRPGESRTRSSLRYLGQELEAVPSGALSAVTGPANLAYTGAKALFGDEAAKEQLRAIPREIGKQAREFASSPLGYAATIQPETVGQLAGQTLAGGALAKAVPKMPAAASRALSVAKEPEMGGLVGAAAATPMGHPFLGYMAGRGLWRGLFKESPEATVARQVERSLLRQDATEAAQATRPRLQGTPFSPGGLPSPITAEQPGLTAAQYEARARDLMQRGKEQDILDRAAAREAAKNMPAEEIAAQQAKQTLMRQDALEAARVGRPALQGTPFSPGGLPSPITAEQPALTATQYEAMADPHSFEGLAGGTQQLPPITPQGATPTPPAPRGIRPSPLEVEATRLNRPGIVTPEEYARARQLIGRGADRQPGEGIIEWMARVRGGIRAARPAAGDIIYEDYF